MVQFGMWIPVKWRDLTEEEVEYYKSMDIIVPCAMAEFKLPEDGDEILISKNNGKWVSAVVFCNDSTEGIGDEYGNDWLIEVDAWMPMPKGYIKSDAEDEIKNSMSSEDLYIPFKGTSETMQEKLDEIMHLTQEKK